MSKNIFFGTEYNLEEFQIRGICSSSYSSEYTRSTGKEYWRYLARNGRFIEVTCWNHSFTENLQTSNAFQGIEECKKVCILASLNVTAMHNEFSASKRFILQQKYHSKYDWISIYCMFSSTKMLSLYQRILKKIYSRYLSADNIIIVRRY